MEKKPDAITSTLSPGEQMLATAASQAPWPDEAIGEDGLLGIEDATKPFAALGEDGAELVSGIVDGSAAHRPENTFRHVGRAGVLEQLPSASHRHLSGSRRHVSFNSSLEPEQAAVAAPQGRSAATAGPRQLALTAKLARYSVGLVGSNSFPRIISLR